MGFWSSIGSAVSSACSAVGSALSSACGAIGSTFSSACSGVFNAIAGIASVANALASVGRALGVALPYLQTALTVVTVIDMVLQALGLAGKDEKVEDLGQDVLDAYEADIKPADYSTYDEYMQAIRNFRLENPDKQGNHDTTNKLIAGISVQTWGLEEKIGAFEQNKNAVVQDYFPEDRRLIETYQKHKLIYDDFCHKIAIDKQKLAGITLKLSELEKEHKRIVGLNKVDNVFTTLQVTVCPTCKQQLPIGEERKEEKVAKSQLEEIDHLISSKKTFLGTLKDITENNLQQKQLHLLYIEKLLLQDKALVDQLSNETYFSASGISEVEIMEIAKLKLELEQTKALLNKVDTAKERLSIIKEEYEEYDKEYKSLRSNECKGLETSLSKFVVIFKNYLIGFEYKSNYKSQIYLEPNSESSYKYFPMVQMQNDSSELIRSVSSASDFIRSIWAYYLALLRVGCKHPGFVIFDEPCQQSMDESSLLKLFECGSSFMDKQLIFFCSSQPHTSKAKNDTHDNIIKDIIQNLPNKAMINVIEFEDKAIDEI